MPILFLTACDEVDQISYCDEELTPIFCQMKNPLNKDIFKVCMDGVAKARGTTGNYTTHDDEDLDSVVKACTKASKNRNRLYETECKPHPRYVAQQEFCKGKPND